MIWAHRFLFIHATAAALALLVAQPAHAVTREQLKQCEGKDDVSPDQRITSCTAVIGDVPVDVEIGRQALLTLSL